MEHAPQTLLLQNRQWCLGFILRLPSNESQTAQLVASANPPVPNVPPAPNIESEASDEAPYESLGPKEDSRGLLAIPPVDLRNMLLLAAAGKLSLSQRLVNCK